MSNVYYYLLFSIPKTFQYFGNYQRVHKIICLRANGVLNGTFLGKTIDLVPKFGFQFNFAEFRYTEKT